MAGVSMKNMNMGIMAGVAVLLSVCNTGCREAPDSPREILLYVVKKARNGDWREVYQYVTPNLYNLMRNLQTDIAIGTYAAKQKRKVIETISGDSAYVSVFFINVTSPVTFYFKRTDGKWKIDIPDKKPDEGFSLEDIIPYVEDGDFILSSEDHLSSYYIRSLSAADKRFSHSGIIRKENGIITVIGAEGLENKYTEKKPGVTEKTLEDYIQDKNNIGIYRAKRNNRKLYSCKAMEYIGVPFDYKYTLDNERELYCTQFVQVVLRETNTGIQLRKTYVKREGKDIILPDSISSSDDFDEIRYIERQSAYANKTLSWGRTRNENHDCKIPVRPPVR
jgi:hypothetical protein